ncbi:MAG TPA: UDP-N-acetylmuramoyl-L-alanine--D-glutamate ligase [Candidatus Saccharimonadales bacterium]|nr:UDP-N-acetylmuramoyl-L-alanine--D-glutamate ligase [Candidatus Saccharimonadales bacterium]
MKVAILGYGIEGQSAARYWGAQGHDITICDSNADIALSSEYAAKLGPNYLKDLDQFDLIVRSQSVNPISFITTKPVTSITNEFLNQCPVPIIGVTGTKGKGTTSSLIAKILEAAGRKVHLGGNIGTSPLDFLDDIRDGDLVVLEMSSFQLMGITRSPQVAVMLMIAPDHLDWHADLGEYAQAKANIFKFQTPDDIAVYNCSNTESLRLGQASRARHLPFNSRSGAWVDDETVKFKDQSICETGDVGLVGPHNLENICAAVAATWDMTEGNVEAIRTAIKAFKGLEHRLELAGEVGGVRYYDDSFSTNPDTAIAAIKAFKEPKVVILGGSDKKADFSRLAEEVKMGKIRQVILIGKTGLQIKKALDRAGFKHYQEGPGQMPEIVKLAASVAKAGDVVLLSPASASFDLFKNYKDRGDQFQAAVKSLA